MARRLRALPAPTAIVAMTIAVFILSLGVISCRWDRPPEMVVAIALYRGVSQGDELGWHDGVSVGDVLSLELELSRPLYVYIWNRDETGREALLFPRATLDDDDLLPGNEVQRLPRPAGGMARFWQVSSDGGREQIWIIAAAARIADFGNFRGSATTLPSRLVEAMNDMERSDGAVGEALRCGSFVCDTVELDGEERAWVGLLELGGEP